MHLFFWKHSKKSENVIIKKSCYDKLPKKHQDQFVIHNIIEDEPTHHVMVMDDSFQLYNTLGIGNIILSDNITSYDQIPEGPLPPMEQQFEGGSGGGAGAGGDFSTQDDCYRPQSDPTTTSDSSESQSQTVDSPSLDQSSYPDSGNSFTDNSGF